MSNTKQFTTTCISWWNDLNHRPGDRAQLRRAGSIADAMMVPATHRLADSVRSLGMTSMRRVALLAALLAQLKECETSGASLPESLGQKRGDQSTFSELRFRRLLQVANEDDLLLHLRRAVRILNNRVHLPSLIEAIRFWSFDPDKRTQMITRWACDYYGTAPTPTSV